MVKKKVYETLWKIIWCFGEKIMLQCVKMVAHNDFCTVYVLKSTGIILLRTLGYLYVRFRYVLCTIGKVEIDQHHLGSSSVEHQHQEKICAPK